VARVVRDDGAICSNCARLHEALPQLTRAPHNQKARPKQSARKFTGFAPNWSVAAEYDGLFLDTGASASTRSSQSRAIKFRNGSSRNDLDRPSEQLRGHEDDSIEYKLTGYFAKLDLVLLEIGYWEGGQWMLVRLDDGTETKCMPFPACRRGLASRTPEGARASGAPVAGASPGAAGREGHAGGVIRITRRR
jgi:hypothetical protein